MTEKKDRDIGDVIDAILAIEEVPKDSYIRLDTTGPRQETVRILLQSMFAKLLSSNLK